MARFGVARISLRPMRQGLRADSIACDSFDGGFPGAVHVCTLSVAERRSVVRLLSGRNGMRREQKSPRRTQTVFVFLIAAVLGVFSCGCGTMPSGRAWGENAIYPFEWKRIPQAAKNAALDPITWVPLS